MTNFSKIKIGEFFEASDGEKYKKTTELTFNDAYGLEHYIDPLFDKKIGAPQTTAPIIDTSARIVKGTPVEELNPEPPKAEKAPKKRAKKAPKKVSE